MGKKERGRGNCPLPVAVEYMISPGLLERGENFLVPLRSKFEKSELRPGRDLNPGQKLRRLLGCPLPYRDTIRWRSDHNHIISFHK